MLKANRVIYENIAVIFIHNEFFEELRLLHFDEQSICVQAKLAWLEALPKHIL